MPTITPFLWFNDQAEEAMQFYTSIFDNSRILDVARSADGRVFTATFEINGQQIMALNGGPQFTFTEAISLFVKCDTQEQVDVLWEKLTAGGEESQCGWLKDKYGLSWQIIPAALGEMLGDPDPEKVGRVMNAMLGMHKIETAGLKAAYDSK